MKEKILKGLKYLGITFILLVVTFFIFRKNLYNYFLSEVQKKFSSKYHCQLIVNELEPQGLLGVNISGLALVPENRDTLFKVKELNGSIKFWRLITGKLRLSSVSVKNAKITAVGLKDKNNFSFLLKGSSVKKDSITERNYAALVNRIVGAAFSSLPDHVEIKENQLSYIDESGSCNIFIPLFEYNSSKLQGEFQVQRNKEIDKWIVKGSINKSKEHFEGKIYGDSTSVILPYVNDKYKLQCRFDTLYFALNDKDFDDDSLMLKGKVSIHNFYIRHPKLDSNAIILKHVEADYNFDFGKSSVAFSSSNILLNQIAFEIKSGFSKDSSNKYFLQAKMKKLKAQDFFNSLPEGLFATLDGIQCDGELAYDLNFAIDVARPDCVLFDSKLSEFGFKIKKYGSTDLSKMNGSFLYTAYEKAKPVKSFIVGSDNPTFTTLDQISPYLRSAVLQSEDGSFFYHNGFREDAFRKAVAENVKKGRFARGGSTISMQLVKNVFLSRKKTVARKIEEALIVWMIEKKRLVSKERMYEVYLNIIEWGPGIYGIAEASQFYFNKKPAELTIEESIFLTSIIPRPKSFKWSFDDSGNLKPHLKSYFDLISDLMMRRETITQEQKDAIVPNIQLTGIARKMVVKDSVASDGFDAEEEF